MHLYKAKVFLVSLFVLPSFCLKAEDVDPYDKSLPFSSLRKEAEEKSFRCSKKNGPEMDALSEKFNLEKTLRYLEKADVSGDRSFLSKYIPAFLSKNSSNLSEVEKLPMIAEWGLYLTQCSGDLKVYTLVKKLIEEGKALSLKDRKKIAEVTLRMMDFESPYSHSLLNVILYSSLVDSLVTYKYMSPYLNYKKDYTELRESMGALKKKLKKDNEKMTEQNSREVFKNSIEADLILSQKFKADLKKIVSQLR